MGDMLKAVEFDKNRTLGLDTTDDNPLRVLVTGAGGQVAYSLFYPLVSGCVFGEQPLALVLYDTEAMANIVKGVAMEVADSCSSLLRELVFTTHVPTAFKDVDVAILMASVVPIDTEPSSFAKDRLIGNVKIYKEHAEALNVHAKKTVKVVVVAEPSSALTSVCMQYAPDILPINFTSLTRLYQNRTVAQAALLTNVSTSNVRNVIVWGNHADVIIPDVTYASIKLLNNWNPALKAINNDHWSKNELVTIVQERSVAVSTALKISNSMSTAKAICDHLHDWMFGTKPGEWVNMGVVSDGSYGIEPGLVFGYPVRISKSGRYSIVDNLLIDEYIWQSIKPSVKAAQSERYAALGICQELDEAAKKR